MIRKLLATSAIAAVVATGAFAQSSTTQTAPADANAPAATTDQAARPRSNLPTAFWPPI